MNTAELLDFLPKISMYLFVVLILLLILLAIQWKHDL